MILNLLLLEQVIVIDRMFQTNHQNYLWFKNFNVAKDNVILAHKNLFDQC